MESASVTSTLLVDSEVHRERRTRINNLLSSRSRIEQSLDLRVEILGDCESCHTSDTRRLQFLIDAQENRGIGWKLDIRAFRDKGLVDLHGSPVVAEANGRDCRCLCRSGAKQSETFITISRS